MEIIRCDKCGGDAELCKYYLESENRRLKSENAAIKVKLENLDWLLKLKWR